MLFTSFVKDPYEVCTGGFAPGFFADWWNDGVDRAWLVSDGTGGYVLSEDRQRQLLAQWSAIAQEST